jgi:hypothetical protein
MSGSILLAATARACRLHTCLSNLLNKLNSQFNPSKSVARVRCQVANNFSLQFFLQFHPPLIENGGRSDGEVKYRKSTWACWCNYEPRETAWPHKRSAMAKQGSAFGIDCSSGNYLTNLNLPAPVPGQPAPKVVPWADIKAWRAAIPADPNKPGGLPATPCAFAGRYFNPWGGQNNWLVGENKGVRTAAPPNAQPLNADIEYVFPIQGFKNDAQNLRVSGRDKQGGVEVEEDAETVQAWGAEDAKQTCKLIVDAVGRNELKYPLLGTVIVYLDIEAGVNLSADYWYGWASAVFWYCTGFRHPFYPGVYCPTTHNPNDAGGKNELHRIPSGTKTLLNSVAAGVQTVQALPNVFGVVQNAEVAVDAYTPDEEWVKVTAVSEQHGTFTAKFTKAHQAGAVLRCGEVQTGLTRPPNNLASVCWGVWASNPGRFTTTGFDDPAFPMKDRKDRNFRPDWENRFDQWTQVVHTLFGLIPFPWPVRVRLWQYAADVVFGDRSIDLDEKSPDWEALAWMLKVV